MATSDLRVATKNMTISFDMNGSIPFVVPSQLLQTNVSGATKRPSLKTCCPTCLDTDEVIIETGRVAVCKTHDKHVFSESELPRWHEVDGERALVGTADEVKQAKAELKPDSDERQAKFRSFTASTFHAVESGDVYVIDPRGDTPKAIVSMLFASLTEANTVKVGRDQFAIAGWMDGLRGGERQFVRLVKRFDRLCVATLEYSSKFRTDIPVGEYDKPSKDLLSTFKDMIAVNANDFEPAEYVDPSADTLAAVVERVAEIRAGKPADAEGDAFAALEAMLKAS